MADLAAGALRDLAAASPQGALKNAVLAQMGLSLVCSIYHADVSGVRPCAPVPPSPSRRPLPPARPPPARKDIKPASLGRGICVVRLVRGRPPSPARAGRVRSRAVPAEGRVLTRFAAAVQFIGLLGYMALLLSHLEAINAVREGSPPRPPVPYPPPAPPTAHAHTCSYRPPWVPDRPPWLLAAPGGGKRCLSRPLVPPFPVGPEAGLAPAVCRRHTPHEGGGGREGGATGDGGAPGGSESGVLRGPVRG